MPEPKAGESQQEFVSRCVPIVIGEGATKEQALGKCYGMYKSAKKQSVKESISMINDLIHKEEEDIAIRQYSPEILKAREVGGYESPEPGNLQEEGKKILARVYAKCRKDGGDKEKCARISWSAVHNAGYKSESKAEIYKRLEKSLTALVKIIKEERIGTEHGTIPVQDKKIPIEDVMPKEKGSIGEQVAENYYSDRQYAKAIAEMFKKAKVVDVPVEDLIATQDELDQKALMSKEAKDDNRPVKIIEHSGRRYIYDGHHRVAVAKLEGKKSVRGKVISVDGKANPIAKAFIAKTIMQIDSILDKAWRSKKGGKLPLSDELKKESRMWLSASRKTILENHGKKSSTTQKNTQKKP